MLSVFRFPRPTGPYAVGTLTYRWTDTDRPELFGSHGPREIVAQVWYPARVSALAARAPYIDDARSVGPALARLFHKPSFVLHHLRYVRTNAVVGAGVAGDKPSYPVLVFSSGLFGFRQSNTIQVEELVSHGYIVVGLDQPGAQAVVRLRDGREIIPLSRDRMQALVLQSVEPQTPAPTLGGRAMPDGIVSYFARDLSFALDQLAAVNARDPQHELTGRLDLGRVGAFGFSLGGMNVAQACANDRRFKACLIMDVFIPHDATTRGVHQPTMFITRDATTMRLERKRLGGWTEHDIALTLGTMQRAYEALAGAAAYIEIDGMFHLNFTDVPVWIPLARRLGLTGPIGDRRGFEIVNAYALAFFDRQLEGESKPPPDARRYPEVRVRIRNW